jgi:hypothetical protein
MYLRKMAHFERTPQRTVRDLPPQPRAPTSVVSTSLYAPIDSENGDIRLLELAPGNFEDDIEIRLIPANLYDNSSFRYEALSYVWGTHVAFRKAVVDDKAVTIKFNLDGALRHLRFKIVPRLLWVDAVSINQDDTEERNRQVQMMGKIYSTASQVVVWFGPVEHNDTHTRAILGAMQLLWRHDDTCNIALFDYLCSIVALHEERTSLPRESNLCVLKSLHRIVDRPWFSRLWTVQELALSKSATVYIGSFSFPWQPFETFARWLLDKKLDLTSSPVLGAALARVSKATSERPFNSQLYRTLHLTASDPRDKIYSILGISTFSGPPIRPDYSKSVQMVFAEAVVTLLHEAQWDIYMHAPLQPLRLWLEIEHDVLPGLPSWVPDLRIEGAIYTERTRPAERQESRFHESYHRPGTILRQGLTRRTTQGTSSSTSWFDLFESPACSADMTTLRVAGIFLGTIIETSGTRFDNLDLVGRPPRLHRDILNFYRQSAKLKGIGPGLFMSTLMSSALPASYATEDQLALLDPD